MEGGVEGSLARRREKRIPKKRGGELIQEKETLKKNHERFKI